MRVTTDKRRVVQGTPVQALISARYFFGEPVARANVKYVVHTLRYWFPLYASDDEDADDRTGTKASTARRAGARGERASSTPMASSRSRFRPRSTSITTTCVPDRGARDRLRQSRDRRGERRGGHARQLPGQYRAESICLSSPARPRRLTWRLATTTAIRVQTPVHVDLTEHFWKKPDGRSTTADRRAHRRERKGEGVVRRQAAAGRYSARVSAKTPEGRDVESRTLRLGHRIGRRLVSRRRTSGCRSSPTRSRTRPARRPRC